MNILEVEQQSFFITLESQEFNILSDQLSFNNNKRSSNTVEVGNGRVLLGTGKRNGRK